MDRVAAPMHQPPTPGAKHTRSWHSRYECRAEETDRGCAFFNMCLDWDARFAFYESPHSIQHGSLPRDVNLIPDVIWNYKSAGLYAAQQIRDRWGRTFNFSVHHTPPLPGFRRLPHDNVTTVIAAVNAGNPSIGHALADSVWPVIRVLLLLKDTVPLLEEGTRTQVVLSTRSCGAEDMSTGFRCEGELKAWQSISSAPIRYADELNGTCFARLVVGSSHHTYIRDANYANVKGFGPLKYTPPQPHKGVLHFFQQLCRRTLALSTPSLAPVTIQASVQRRRQLVISHKGNQRHWISNEHELLEYLQGRYSEMNVRLIDFASLTAIEEIASMQATSVYITSMGGGSFNTAWLPDNACVIFAIPCMPIFSPLRNSSTALCQQIKNEMKVWKSAKYLSVLSYEHDDPRDMEEKLGSQKDRSKWPGVDWAYRVNVTRMSALVQTCMESTTRLWSVRPETRITLSIKPPRAGRLR